MPRTSASARGAADPQGQQRDRPPLSLPVKLGKVDADVLKVRAFVCASAHMQLRFVISGRHVALWPQNMTNYAC